MTGAIVDWTWDRNKAAANLKKHKVSFELAARIFDDPNQLSRPDQDPDEERWQTLGRPFGTGSGVLLVVHTEIDDQGGSGRIISARKATSHEGELMKKEDSEPSPQPLRDELAALEAMKDSDIDTSDIPETADWSGAVRGRFYRPVKQLLSVRLDSDVVAWFKSAGDGYQTRINAALREHVRSHSPKV